MKVGIVGHAADKFTPKSKELAKDVIRDIMTEAKGELWATPGREAESLVIVSGGCHLGGIDVWAEEMADFKILADETEIYPSTTRKWDGPGGYKERNLKIAEACDVVHCIVVDRLPDSYEGMRFPLCYHCGTKDHVKSGGCWTAKRAKRGVWHIIKNA